MDSRIISVHHVDASTVDVVEIHDEVQYVTRQPLGSDYQAAMLARVPEAQAENDAIKARRIADRILAGADSMLAYSEYLSSGSPRLMRRLIRVAAANTDPRVILGCSALIEHLLASHTNAEIRALLGISSLTELTAKYNAAKVIAPSLPAACGVVEL